MDVQLGQHGAPPELLGHRRHSFDRYVAEVTALGQDAIIDALPSR